jgi:hypothetical protein
LLLAPFEDIGIIHGVPKIGLTVLFLNVAANSDFSTATVPVGDFGPQNLGVVVVVVVDLVEPEARFMKEEFRATNNFGVDT